MHDTTLTPTPASDAATELSAAAKRAQEWFGEPFLNPDEDPAEALATGTARRFALDDALAEMAAGRAEPSSRWKVRYGLMLGLERVLSAKPPTTAAGTELRRHQIDALAGMLTELIAANQRAAEEEANGNGQGNGTAVLEADAEIEDEDDEDAGVVDEDDDELALHGRGSGRVTPLPLPPPDRLGQDDRRSRLRRGSAAPRDPDPHAPPPARLAVPARPHDRGLPRPLHRRDHARQRAGAAGSDHDPDLRLVRAAPRRRSRARRTSSSSATRRTRRSARRPAPRSAPSTSRSTSA